MSPPATLKAAKKSRRKLAHLTEEYPEGTGIKIALMPNKTGGISYGASYHVRIPGKLLGKPGQREFHQCATLADAKRYAEDRLLALRQGGTRFADLPPSAQSQVLTAWGILKVHGIGFVEAAEAAVRSLRPAGGTRTVAEVFAELKQSKQARFLKGDMRARSWEDYRTRSAKIEATLGNRPVNLVNHEEIIAWLRKLGTEGCGDGPLGSRSVKNYRVCASELFGYAYKKRYCSENPFTRITQEEVRECGGQKNKRAQINVLTVDEAAKLLTKARAHPELGLLPSVILRLFCGLRTEEIVRLDWHDVRWQEAPPYVHISEDNAKGRAARNVTIGTTALEWLTLCPVKVGSVSPLKTSPSYCKRFRRLQKLAGMGTVSAETGKWKSTWETNDTRHSFGSYHFAFYGDATLTSTEMGHRQGDAMLFSHYRRLTTKAEGQRYFDLRPTTAAGNVTAFPQAATG